MDTRASSIRLCLTAALLAALVVSARSGRSPTRTTDATIEHCELDPPQAIDGLERCLALLPHDVELMLDLGALHEAQGASDRAEALYRRALEVDSQDGDVHLRLGRVLLTRGDVELAAERARTALTLQPQSPRGRELLEQAMRGGRQ